jgi:methionyl-tRNA formyltransferase
MVLCGRSPVICTWPTRCAIGEVLAIVQETGSEFSWKKLAAPAAPRQLLPQVWRWLRDRRRYTGNREAKFFFGDQTAASGPPELVREVPHINHPDVVAWRANCSPTGRRLRHLADPRRTAARGAAGHHQPARRPVARIPRRRLHLLGALQRRAGEGRLHAALDRRRHRHRRLIAHVSPPVRPDDDELKLFWRACRTAPRSMPSCCSAWPPASASARRQPHKGRLYQVKQRGLRHEREVDRRLRQGLLQGLALERRITWFPAPPSASTARPAEQAVPH